MRDPMDAIAIALGSPTRLPAAALADARALPLRVQKLRHGTSIVRHGQLVSECALLLDGYACRDKIAKDGRRQIVSFHVAGDILGLAHLRLLKADHNIDAATDASVAFVAIDALRALIARWPDIGISLWRASLIEAAVLREWVLNVGRRNATTRVAHLLCEFLTRSEAAGLGQPVEQAIPFSQEQIGDATGLTSVHVNRTIRGLRELGVLGGAGPRCHVVDWQRLCEIATFRPDYLHQTA